MEMRRAFFARPPYFRSGAKVFQLPRAWVRRNAEIAIIAEFVSRRRLFGEVYRQLQPDYFGQMPPASGVFILAVAPTALVAPGATRPGDIDLLIVPYEGAELVLHRTLALEVKVVRATVARPGRSPNEFGVSQAQGLQALGFPFVGLLHLIVSDERPRERWSPMRAFQVVDETGTARPLPDRQVDTLPLELVRRAYGRLQGACPSAGIGLGAIFVRYADLAVAERYGDAMWVPDCREPLPNSWIDASLLTRVGELFDANPQRWFDTRRRD